MARKREITEIETFISLKTAVKHVYEECETEEDAIFYIEEGMVKINGKTINDPYYGINGCFTIKVGEFIKETSFQSDKLDYLALGKRILKFANDKDNLAKLRNGEVLTWIDQTKRYGVRGFHLSLTPPTFNGNVLTACYFGWTNPRDGQTWSTPTQAVTECGARL